MNARTPFTRMPEMPNETAAEKLMMLGGQAVCDLFIRHMRLRAMRGMIDAEALERCSNELGQIAHEAGRS